MEGNTNPDLDKICRLCLSILDDSELVDIFSRSGDASAAAASMQMSIPMRIMACAALEVQTGDGLPKLICQECRYQLEKSYYFRKRSQLSDTKLRKHIRLLNLGKKSRVFEKNEDDDDEDELEFEDSIKFIQQKEEEKHTEEYSLLEEKLKKDFDAKMNKWIEQYKEDIKEEVTNELRNAVVTEVKEELRAEMEDEIRTALREECMEQAKTELRSEVMEECREKERVALLDDLQIFLNQKRDRPSLLKVNNVYNNKTIMKVREKNNKNPILSNETVRSVTKRSATEVAHSNEIEENDVISSENHEIAEEEGAPEEEQEFFLIETENSQEDAAMETAKPTKKRQKMDHSQSYEYFEDKMGTANFRLTASEIITPEAGAQAYHDTDEEQYYKRLSNSNNEINGDNEHDAENEEDSVILFNLADDLEDDEQNEGMDLAELKKLYVLRSSKKSMENATKEQVEKPKSVGKELFTKHVENEAEVDTAEDKAFPVPLRKTDTPKTFKCDSCPMCFSTKNSLDRHMRTHAKLEQRGVSHQCKVCLMYLSCKSALKRHMVIHTGEKPHTCDFCGKSFVQREVMKRHMLTHAETKPHKCNKCSRTYSNKHSLMSHMQRAHSDVPVRQQYACHLCPKRFHHTSGLSRHLVTHTGLTYQCVECKRKFADRSSVKRHILNVHGGEKNATIENGKKIEMEYYTVDEGGDIIETNEENDAEFVV